MNDGYMQLELAEESRKLTTLYTHRGFNHFKRLRSRLNSAVEIFNEEVRKVVALELMPSVSMMTSRYLVPLRKKRCPTCTTQLWWSHMIKGRFKLCLVTFFKQSVFW